MTTTKTPLQTISALEKEKKAKKRGRLKELTTKIKDFLVNDPRYRDDDALLINRVQRDEVIASGIDAATLSFNDFLRIRVEKRVTSEDTITRLRREVQEYYPETRGDKYRKRQGKQTDVVDDLHEIEDDIVEQKSNPQPVKLAPAEVPFAMCPCDNCQGTGKYEGFPCNICDGTGEIAFK